MKIRKLLLALPVCFMLLTMPAASLKANAVTVDIKDNYDAGLLEQEQDPPSSDNSSDSSSSASSAASTASSTASNAASSASTTSNTAASTASSSASTASTSDAATTASTTTNDLPKTGDDDRLLITFTVMLTSFAIFITTFFAGKFGKNA